MDDLLKTLMAKASWNQFSRTLATKYGCFTDSDRTGYRQDRLVKLPELITIPRSLEFPGQDMPGRYYVEASIFLEREQPSFPWNELDETQPILYCALGSVIPFSSKANTLFRAVIDASGIRPEWKWVISVGENNDLTALGSVPDNVMLVNHAPQLALLQRAKIMITHGGANTIKECIYFGVPMIVFPFMATTNTDQPGNAARVVYHGLGVQGDSKKLDGTYVGNLIDYVDRSPYIRSQINIMQQKFREVEAEKPSIALIETILRGQDYR